MRLPRHNLLLCLALFAFVGSLADRAAAADQASPRAVLDHAQRILFLGDSITASGQYVSYFDTWLEQVRPENHPLVIDAGLPSETVSGLSEDGHAGGQFPRPDLFERLDRVLKLTKPDLVFACYGMNCGIYQPLDAQRFEKYQQGIRRLKDAVEQAGAKLILITPPVYDDHVKPLPFSYNEVLDRYSQWLLERRADGWQVIDLHGPMTAETKRRQAENPQFTFAPDGVHPNDDGHWFIAQQLMRYFGDARAADALCRPDTRWTNLVQERTIILRDAYVAAAGHKRPGVAAGLPVEEANERANVISDKINVLRRVHQSTEIRHSLFIAGPTFTGILDEHGAEIWNAGRAGARDGWVLPGGNVLVAWDNEVLEFKPDKTVVFRYTLSAENREVGTVERLADGNTLITEEGPGPACWKSTRRARSCWSFPSSPRRTTPTCKPAWLASCLAARTWCHICWRSR